MNDDNDISRRMVEQCYRTHKTLVNPIVDWTDEQVWYFLQKIAQVEVCSLYSEGFKRLGCIGCPMASKTRSLEFQRWPKYKQLYLNAFNRMLIERDKRGKHTEWKTPEEVFDWWLGVDIIPGQMRLEDFLEDME